jgi:hypothetical protein
MPEWLAVGPMAINDHPNSMVALDLEEDGDLDLVLPGMNSYDILLFENDGAAGFRDSGRLPTEGAAITAITADMDGAGADDLVLVYPDIQEVHVHLAGVRGAPVKTALVRPSFVAAGHLDGDEILDLAVSRWSPGGVYTLLGDGQGGFRPGTTKDAGDGGYAVSLADLDGDDLLDVAITCANTDSIEVFRGDGAGGLGPSVAATVGNWPSSIIPVDLDGVAPLELVGTANLGSSMFVGRLTGETLPVTEVGAGSGPIVVVPADLDRDGDLDIVVANKFENTLGIYRNDAGVLVLHQTLITGDGPTPVVIADLDGDGRLDLAVADGFSNDLMLYLAR